MRALVWFRNDLRVCDNQVLSKAIAQCDDVYPVYCFEERENKQMPLGFRKTGFFRSKFKNEAVEQLQKELQALGSDLIIRKGDPVKILTDLAVELGVKVVFASKEATTEEINTETLLEKSLWHQGIELELCWQSTLFHLEDIPFPVQHLPGIFTEFRKAVEKESSIRRAISKPCKVTTVRNVFSEAIPSLEDFESQRSAEPMGVNNTMVFTGGASAAQERLHYYIWETEAIANYKNTRNGLVGKDYSSKLSPWLALGCITPRQIYEEVKSFEEKVKKNSSTYWLIFELLWRDYFRFVAKKYGAKIFQKNGIHGREVDNNDDQEKFNRWISGHTGNDFVDANMIELKTTGYMSNRGRQNVASYLTKDLKVNWTWGAAYFESVLIDYDPCSNWGNWAYVAGVGNDPRQDRYFDTKSQAQRYDPKGMYTRLWLNKQGTVKA